MAVPAGTPIRLVLCDLGGVVVRFDSAKALTALAGVAGCTPQDVIAALDDALLLGFETGRLTARQFFDGLTQRLHSAPTYEQFTALWNDIFTGNPDVPPILERLRGQCQLASLSNTNALHFEHLMQTSPAMRLFHRHLPSFQLGARKPEPQMYLRALEAMGGIPPWETLYIDDRPDLVAAGQAVGLRSIQFEDAAQLRGALRGAGFEA